MRAVRGKSDGNRVRHLGRQTMKSQGGQQAEHRAGHFFSHGDEIGFTGSQEES